MLSPSFALQVGLMHYLVLASIIFCIGTIGVMLRKNLLVMLMSIELMLNSVNLTLVAFSHFTSNINGQLIVFFIMTIAAAEAAVGLALAVFIFKKFKEVNIRFFDRLKG